MITVFINLVIEMHLMHILTIFYKKIKMKKIDLLNVYFISIALSFCSGLQLSHRFFSTPNHKA